MNLNTAVNLYYVAEKYEVVELKQYLIESISGEFCTQNAILVYEFAELFLILHLKRDAMKTIKDEAEIILQSKQMNNIKMKTLLTILNQKGLNIDSELTLFKLLDDFATGELCIVDLDKDSHSKLVQEARKIRYLTMSIEEFNQGPMRSNLLTEHEKLCILNVLYCGNKSAYEYPVGFTKSTILRKHDELVLTVFR